MCRTPTPCPCGNPAAPGSIRCHDCREGILRPMLGTADQRERDRAAEKQREAEAARRQHVPVPIRKTLAKPFMERPTVLYRVRGH